MTELDFLPEWYQVRQERRRSYFAFVWLGACLLGVMGLWFYLVQNRIAQVRADVDRLAGDQAMVKDQLVNRDKLRATRDEMLRKADISDRLTNSPDVIHVLKKLVDLVPDEAALTSLEVSSELIPPSAPAGQPGQPGQPSAQGGQGGQPGRSGAADQGAAGKGKKPDLERRRYILRITGVAPFDELIGNFVSRVSKSESFTNVQMGYTKDIKRGTKLMRQFELTCQVADDWETTDSGAGRPKAADLADVSAGRKEARK